MGRRLGSVPRLEIMLGGSSVSVCHGDFCMCQTSTLQGAWPRGMVGAPRAPQLSPRPWCHRGVLCSCATLTLGAVAIKSEGPYGVCDAPYVGGVLGSMESPCKAQDHLGRLEAGGGHSAPLPGPLRSPSSTRRHGPPSYLIFSISHILFFHFLHIAF